MTAITVRVTLADLELAMATARTVGLDELPPSLAAPTDAALSGRISDVWEAIERAVKECYTRGREAAEVAVGKAVKSADQAITDLGAQARDLQTMVLQQLQALLSSYVDRALALVRDELIVGTRRMQLASVEVQQKVNLNGNLQLSILEVCEIAASGELSVSARYDAV